MRDERSELARRSSLILPQSRPAGGTYLSITARFSEKDGKSRCLKMPVVGECLRDPLTLLAFPLLINRSSAKTGATTQGEGIAPKWREGRSAEGTVLARRNAAASTCHYDRPIRRKSMEMAGVRMRRPGSSRPRCGSKGPRANCSAESCC